MARINDGGNFSDDLLTRLAARQAGGSLPLDQLDEEDERHRKLKEDAINMAMGTMGTIGKVGAGVKLIPTAENLAAEEGAGMAKNFFQKFGREGKGVGPAATADEQALREFQQQTRDQAIKERNFNQIRRYLSGE